MIGLAVYVALLIVGLRHPVPRRRALARRRIALVACFAALVLHTWTYADFLEDPITWTLLGIGVALARAARVEGKVGEEDDAGEAGRRVSA